MVLRGVGAMRPDVLEFVTDVVKEAAHDRKTVRVSNDTNLYWQFVSLSNWSHNTQVICCSLAKMLVDVICASTAL